MCSIPLERVYQKFLQECVDQQAWSAIAVAFTPLPDESLALDRSPSVRIELLGHDYDYRCELLDNMFCDFVVRMLKDKGLFMDCAAFLAVLTALSALDPPIFHTTTTARFKHLATDIIDF